MLRLFALAFLAAVPPGAGPTPGTAWQPARLPATSVDSAYATTITPKPPQGATATSVTCVCAGAQQLPPGLTGNKLGTAFGISGVPTKEGTYTFVLQDTWSSGGRSYWGRQSFTIVVGKASSAPSDAAVRVGIKAASTGRIVTVLVRAGAKSPVGSFILFPVGSTVKRVVSASAGLRCKREAFGKGSAVACDGGPGGGKTVRVRFEVDRVGRFVIVEASSNHESASVSALIAHG